MSTRRMVEVASLTPAPFHQGRAHLIGVWDPALSNDIVVSLRDDGTMVVVDGWSRVIDAREKGVVAIAAQVFTGLSEKDEARMFIDINSPRREVE